MIDKGTIDNLAASLRRMEEDGAEPEAWAQGHPEANGHLRDLLSLAAEFRAIPKVEPDAATIAEGRQRMLAALEAGSRRRLFAFAGLLAPAAAKAAAIVIAVAILSGAAVATSDALGGPSITRHVFQRVGITRSVAPDPTGGQAGDQSSAPSSDTAGGAGNGGASTSDGQDQHSGTPVSGTGGTPAALGGVFATPKPTATATPPGPYATATPRPTPTHGGTPNCPGLAFPQWLPDDCDATPTPHPTSTPKSTPKPTPKPSQTPKATPKPTPTSTWDCQDSIAPQSLPGDDCDGTPTPTPTPTPTSTPEPDETPEPGETPEPTKTPRPSETPEPSDGPRGAGCDRSWQPSHLDEGDDCPGTPTPTPGGGPSPTPTETPEPDETPEPTKTPKPTRTPKPSETPHDDD